MNKNESDTKINKTVTLQHAEGEFSKEIDLLLEASLSQIEISMSDGEKSIAILTNVFMSLYDKIDAISHYINEIDDSNDVGKRIKENMSPQIGSINQDLSAAIINFQFYDRLSQRVHVVSTCIYELRQAIIAV